MLNSPRSMVQESKLPKHPKSRAAESRREVFAELSAKHGPGIEAPKASEVPGGREQGQAAPRGVGREVAVVVDDCQVESVGVAPQFLGFEFEGAETVEGRQLDEGPAALQGVPAVPAGLARHEEPPFAIQYVGGDRSVASGSEGENVLERELRHGRPTRTLDEVFRVGFVRAGPFSGESVGAGQVVPLLRIPARGQVGVQEETFAAREPDVGAEQEEGACAVGRSEAGPVEPRLSALDPRDSAGDAKGEVVRGGVEDEGENQGSALEFPLALAGVEGDPGGLKDRCVDRESRQEEEQKERGEGRSVLGEAMGEDAVHGSEGGGLPESYKWLQSIIDLVPLANRYKEEGLNS